MVERFEVGHYYRLAGMRSCRPLQGYAMWRDGRVRRCIEELTDIESGEVRYKFDNMGEHNEALFYSRNNMRYFEEVNPVENPTWFDRSIESIIGHNLAMACMGNISKELGFSSSTNDSERKKKLLATLC